MDAFCLSSRYEGLPFTALEALATNLPLILTDGPGLRSFGSPTYGFSHVHYGKVGDADSLASALSAWLQNRTQSTNHREQAASHFSIPVCYGRIAALYEEMVARKASSSSSRK